MYVKEGPRAGFLVVVAKADRGFRGVTALVELITCIRKIFVHFEPANQNEMRDTYEDGERAQHG